jgi:hypothetical protein
MAKLILGLLLIVFGAAQSLVAAEPFTGIVVWNVDNLESIGGHKVTVVGNPRVIETKWGRAVEFDGRGDALFIDANPLAGLKQFTVDVDFRPAADGPKEQRFLHFQSAGSDDRVLFETRLPSEGRWFLDTYLQTGPGKHTLYAEKFPHPTGAWYHATILVDGRSMRHYVNGREEMSADVELIPLAAGGTSIGVRYNKVHWFQGAIRRIRITPAAIEPAPILEP